MPPATVMCRTSGFSQPGAAEDAWNQMQAGLKKYDVLG